MLRFAVEDCEDWAIAVALFLHTSAQREKTGSCYLRASPHLLFAIGITVCFVVVV